MINYRKLGRALAELRNPQINSWYGSRAWGDKTQAAVAKALGFSQAKLSRIEAGQPISLADFWQIVTRYGLKDDQIVKLLRDAEQESEGKSTK